MNAAAERFAAGGAVLIGHGDASPVYVVMAAEGMTSMRLEQVHGLGRGPVVLGLGQEVVDRLKLRHAGPHSLRRGALGSIDAAHLAGGGSSPADRAMTMRTAADPRSGPSDLVTPGHVQPIAVGRDELIGRATAAGAALELARVSGRRSAVALCLVVGRRGRPASLFSARTRRDLALLPHVSPAELQAHDRARRAAQTSITCALPARAGTFELAAHVDDAAGGITLALTHGNIAAAESAPRVCVHHACLLGDAFGSLLCDCRRELDRALDAIVQDGAGVLVYVKPAITAYECGRGGAVNSSTIAGLLQRAGVRVARLGPDTAHLGDALGRLGVEIADTSLARAA